MDHARGLLVPAFDFGDAEVSILVVMDHARGRIPGLRILGGFTCFDPCCHGSCSWAQYSAEAEVALL